MTIASAWVGSSGDGGQVVRTSGSATSDTISIAGATVGDVCFILAAVSLGETGISTPTGWTLVAEGGEGANGATGSRTGLYYRVKQTGDTTFTVSWSSSATKYIIQAFSYSGLDSTTPVEGGAYASHTSGSSYVSPSVTPTAADRWILTCSHARSSTAASTFTPDAALTERIDATNGANAWSSIEVADTAATVSAAAHSYTATGSRSESHGGTIAAALLPASAGGSVTGTAAAPLGALAASASGTPTVTSSATSGLGALAAAAVGAVTVLATAAAALGALTGSATGAVSHTGTATAPLGGLTATAISGPVTGTAAAALGALAGTATGSVAHAGTASGALGALAGTATGTRATTGTAAAALGGLTASASTTPPGVLLLPNTLGGTYRIAYEVAWGADLTDIDGSGWTWSDITRDVRHAQPVSASLGRADEVSTAQPAQMTLTVRNPDGRYTPYNPAGANYPNVRTGTPIRRRISPDSGATWYTRWQGYVTSWARGSTLSGRHATVTLTASGLRQRLSQNAPIAGALRRSILGTTAATLRQYWPCDEESRATRCTSALPGGGPLISSGTVEYGGMDWTSPQTGGITILPGTRFGTGPVVRLTQGGKLYASFTGASASAWTVQMSVYVDPITNNAALTLARWTDSTGRIWEVVSDGITAGTVRLLVNGAAVATHTHIIINEDIRIDASQSGGNVNWSFRPALAYAAITGSFAGTLGAVNTWASNPAGVAVSGDLSVSHVRVWDGNTAPDFKTSTLAVSAWNGYNGEAPYTRAARLCAEEGVALSVLDYNPSTGRTMGPQSAATLLALLDECATTDAATIHDGLGPGLRWQSIMQRYDQNTALTVAATELADPPAPVASDQRLRNRAVVTNTAGGSAVHQDTSGPLGTGLSGVLEASVSVNLANDSQLDDRARWEVHAGTVPGERVPALAVDVAGTPGLAARLLATTNGWTGQQVVPGWLVDVTGLSGVGPEHAAGTLALLVEGWTEDIDPRSTWRLVFNTVSQDAYDVWKVGDATRGRVDTDGHTLGASVAAGVASLSLVTPTGRQLWTTDPAHFPLYLNIAGIRITVSSIAGAASPQTAAVSGVTKALSAGAPVTMWKNGVVKL